MSDIFIDLGIIQIKWYSIFILIAILTASILVLKESKKKNIPEDYIINLLFYGIIIGILGARIYYVLFNLDYYLSNSKEIFMIWNGGLAIHGGIIAALIFIIIYSKKKKINLLLILDIMVVGLILAQSIGRWGNFFNQEAFGRIVSLDFLQNLYLPQFIIDNMYINGYYREPTFLYESILSLIGFIVLIFIRKYKNIRTGTLTGIYFLWYGISRLIIELYRSDSLMLGSIKIAQLVSIIGIIAGIILIFLSRKNKLYKDEKILLDN